VAFLMKLPSTMSSADSARAKPPLPIPMLVGISGKRLFDKTSVQADREIAGRVADRLRGLFGELDDQFPRTPKILLSGFAFGADLIAAETALQCSRKRNWLVAALLPFGRALFEEDFRPPDGADAAWCDHYAEHARTFVRILADPQVIVRELPPLRIEDQGDTLARIDCRARARTMTKSCGAAITSRSASLSPRRQPS
jgi:hypothetical protein